MLVRFLKQITVFKKTEGETVSPGELKRFKAASSALNSVPTAIRIQRSDELFPLPGTSFSQENCQQFLEFLSPYFHTEKEAVSSFSNPTQHVPITGKREAVGAARWVGGAFPLLTAKDTGAIMHSPAAAMDQFTLSLTCTGLPHVCLLLK